MEAFMEGKWKASKLSRIPGNEGWPQKKKSPGSPPGPQKSPLASSGLSASRASTYLPPKRQVHVDHPSSSSHLANHLQFLLLNDRHKSDKLSNLFGSHPCNCVARAGLRPVLSVLLPRGWCSFCNAAERIACSAW